MPEIENFKGKSSLIEEIGDFQSQDVGSYVQSDCAEEGGRFEV